MARGELRWPMVFRLEPCDRELERRAQRTLDVSMDYDAPCERVHRTFFGFSGAEPWAPGFLGVVWLTPIGRLSGAILDEHYTFMSMRVRVIEHVPATRSVAWVDRWSLPLATRMLQVIETTPIEGGRTRLRYRVYYDVPWFGRPFLAPVEAAFEAWFRASLCGLERYLRVHPAEDDRLDPS